MHRLLLIPLLALPFSSCMPGTYARDFAKETATYPKPATSPEGPWIGEWKSEVNGHQGPLWCLVHPTEEKPGHYDFRYRAGWGLVNFGDYVHTVATVPDAEGNLVLDANMELPAGFGTYSVQGKVTAENFKATYESKGDRGTMILKRP
ncbi:hypothetical protein [Haloferula sp.]|uniref:hypothetical protein n=1 Tax=Haloferula sp. TaxID=2497595 RepID=UPI003C77F1C7